MFFCSRVRGSWKAFSFAGRIKALMKASMLLSSVGIAGMYSKVGRRKALAGADEMVEGVSWGTMSGSLPGFAVGTDEGFEMAGCVECSRVEWGDCGVGGIDEFVKSTLWNGCTVE